MHEREIHTAYFLADPAFAHWSASDTVRWSYTREADKMPALREGVKPVEYRFQRLTRSQIYAYVHTAASEQERYERAFAAGIVEVVGPDGTWRPVSRGEPGYVACPPEELDTAGIPLAVTWDVGQWIYGRSVLGKGCAPRLSALPTSLLAWDALEHRSAEPSQE